MSEKQTSRASDLLVNPPQDKSEYDEAYDLAHRVHKYETRRSHLVGGMAILAEEFTSGKNRTNLSRAAHAEMMAHERLTRASEDKKRVEIQEKIEDWSRSDSARNTAQRQLTIHDNNTARLRKERADGDAPLNPHLEKNVHESDEFLKAKAAGELVHAWIDKHGESDPSVIEGIKSADDIKAIAEIAKEEIEEIDDIVSEVYSGGRAPSEQQVDDIMNEVAQRK